MLPSGPTLFEHRRRVISHRIVACLRHALALYGEDVQQHRAGYVLHIVEPVAQRRQVVAVDRADVVEAEFLEEHAAGEQGLDGVANVLEGVVAMPPRIGNLRQEIADLLLGVLVETWSAGHGRGIVASAPTRGQIDIWLSLRMTSIFRFRWPALLSASKTIPDGNAPSPITATLWRSSPAHHRRRRLAGRATVETRAAGVPGHEQVVSGFRAGWGSPSARPWCECCRSG